MGYRELGLTSFLCAATFATAAVAACEPDRISLRGNWGEAQFTVKVADDPETRARGLMFVEDMPRGEGMLFVYESPRRATFWMKNTYIPLDMIFIDPAGLVTRVHSEAIPEDETPIDGGPGVLFVLEVNGGLAELYGIGEGTEVRHPAISPEQAVWPCEG